MAGGINAAVVVCLECTGKANRISEGLETDYYECVACSQQFGIDWSQAGPPEKPCWPPSPEQIERVKKASVLTSDLDLSLNDLDDVEPIHIEEKPSGLWWQFGKRGRHR